MNSEGGYLIPLDFVDSIAFESIDGLNWLFKPIEEMSEFEFCGRSYYDAEKAYIQHDYEDIWLW